MLGHNKEIFRIDQNENGYRLKNGIVTAFKERKLFLKSKNNYETGQEIPVLKAGTSASSEAERISLTSGIKRKVGSETEDDESIKRTKIGVKTIKNETNDATNSIHEEDELSVVDSLFSNDLLLRTIFANLNVKDLKSCRQVNNLWNFEATKILLKNENLYPIQISNTTASLHNAAVFKCPIELQDFRNIIANSKLFPITSFALGDEPLSRNIIDFFRDHGHLVKSFCVEPEDSCTTSFDAATGDEILLLAAMHFPNLSALKLVIQFNRRQSTPVVEMAIDYCPDMKNLRTLEIPPGFPADVLARILKKASNIENIYLYYYEDMAINSGLEHLVNLKNFIPRLKNMSFYFIETFDKFQEVLKQKPRLSTIGTIDVTESDPVDEAEVGRYLTKLFHQCSESLTEILNVLRLKEIPGLNIPVLPNVKRLDIKPECLLSGVNFAQAFPNLIKVEVQCWDDDEPEEFAWESLSRCLSVRNLRVYETSRYLPEIWIKIFCFLFPNVISADFSTPLLDSACEYIWNLRALQNLHIVFGSRSIENGPFALDSAFTGFSVDTVRNLYMMNAEDWNMSPEQVEAKRIKPCIVDLKELTSLSLHLNTSFIEEPNEKLQSGEDTFGNKNMEVIFDPGEGKALLQAEGTVVMSYVTKLFGFDLCPRLRSNVSVGFTYYTKFNAEDGW